MPFTPPEIAAKDALEQALQGWFDLALVGIHYGQMPPQPPTRKNIEIGGVVADEDASTFEAGVNTDEVFRVQLHCIGEELDDVTPAGARKASAATFELVHGVRRAVRTAADSGALVVNRPDLFVWWGHVTTAASTPGPEPYEDGGWVETAIAEVQFHARIRS